MTWQRRYFKGKEVWVEVDHIGDPIVEDGRVSMRYQDDPEAKVYRPHFRNISDKPADVVDAEREFDKGESKKSGTKSKASTITKAVSPDDWGPRRISQALPDELDDIAGPEPEIIEIHTDGACSGNPGPCGYGAVIRQDDDYKEISQFLGIGTNNIAELMAIRVALESVEDKSTPVRLYTDSSYCIGVLTKGWKAKANRELILSIRELIDEFSDLKLLKVKGHSDHPLNDRADHLATSSLEYR